MVLISLDPPPPPGQNINTELGGVSTRIATMFSATFYDKKIYKNKYFCFLLIIFEISHVFIFPMGIFIFGGRLPRSPQSSHSAPAFTMENPIQNGSRSGHGENLGVCAKREIFRKLSVENKIFLFVYFLS